MKPRRFPSQSAVLNRLEDQTRQASRQHEDACVEAMRGLWATTKKTLRGVVMSNYPRGGLWNMRTARQPLWNIAKESNRELTRFYHGAKLLVERSLSESYRHEAQRQAWMLDQLTPPSYRAVLPTKALRESDTSDIWRNSPSWFEAVGVWIEAYASNLQTNLRLEALHEGSIQDAADEVDAAKIDGFDPAYKFASMLSNQILSTQREARADVGEANQGLVAVEIFQTMEDSAVCPDCDSQDGVPVEDVQVFGHVYSFNCRCFERIVPKQWAALLRSGNAEERKAAIMMDARGIVPDSMAITGPDGSLIGTFTVPFDKWSAAQGMKPIAGVTQ